MPLKRRNDREKWRHCVSSPGGLTWRLKQRSSADVSDPHDTLDAVSCRKNACQQVGHRLGSSWVANEPVTASQRHRREILQIQWSHWNDSNAQAILAPGQAKRMMSLM